MRSMFTSGFGPGRIYLPSKASLMAASRRPALGAALSESERMSLLDLVQAGEIRLSTVQRWIASRIDLDPMLRKTFGQPHIVDNFWGYSELVQKDQYYVDEAVRILNDDSTNWDVSEEIVSRTQEWSAAIDIMYDAMQRYGKTPLTTPAGAPIQNTVAPSAGVPSTTTGGGQIQPGTGVEEKPPSRGVEMKDVLLYGGIGLGAIALIAILKKIA